LRKFIQVISFTLKNDKKLQKSIKIPDVLQGKQVQAEIYEKFIHYWVQSI